MRVIHVFNSSVVSGPETLVIPALQNLGLPVSIVFLSETRLGNRCEGPVEYAKGFGHDVHVVQVHSRFDRRAIGDLRKVFENLNATVVHAHDVKASLYSLLAVQAKSRLPVKLVSTHHGTIARKGILRLYEELYVRWALPKFQTVLAVCELDKRSLLRRGIPPRILKLHHNGIERPFVSPDNRSRQSSDMRQKWNQFPDGKEILQSDLVLGVVARLSPEKRHDRILNVFRILLSRPDLKQVSLRLVCFGMGSLESELKEMTKRLGLEKNVSWMGYSREIGQQMAGFDMLLCLSDGEGIPVNLLEAGWAGTPVFSTRVGGIPEVIDESVGFLVDVKQSDEEIAEKLAVAILDSRLRTQVGQSYQQKVVCEFSEQAWLSGLREIYLEERIQKTQRQTILSERLEQKRSLFETKAQRLQNHRQNLKM